MANERWRYRGWCPTPSNDYKVEEVIGPAILRKRYDGGAPRHQKKGHVAFKTNIEEEVVPTATTTTTTTTTVAEAEPVPVAEAATTTNPANGFVSVDKKADAFIKQEHRRIQLARLKSLGLA